MRLSPEHGEHLEGEQVGRRELALLLHELLDVRGDADSEQEVDHPGGVDDGHSPRSRIARTAISLGCAGAAVPRASMRAASSSGVGRVAVRASTARTYSE